MALTSRRLAPTFIVGADDVRGLPLRQVARRQARGRLPAFAAAAHAAAALRLGLARAQGRYQSKPHKATRVKG